MESRAVTDAEYLTDLLERADRWLRSPGRNMLNDTDDLVLRLTQATLVLQEKLSEPIETGVVFRRAIQLPSGAKP